MMSVKHVKKIVHCEKDNVAADHDFRLGILLMDDRNRPPDQVDHVSHLNTLNRIAAIIRLIPNLIVLDAVLEVTDDETHIVKVTQNFFLRFES